MRITDLLKENNQLDELNLSGMKQRVSNFFGGANKAAPPADAGTTPPTQPDATAGTTPAPKNTALGLAQKAVKGAGMVAGAPAAIKAQFQAGKQAAIDKFTGKTDQADTRVEPTLDPAAPLPTATNPTPVDDTEDKGFGFDGHTGKPFASQAERDAWFKSNGKVDPKAAGNTTEPTAPAPTEPAAPTAPAGMKANEIVTGLKTTWDKARASQDSQTSAPAVKAQIVAIAKDAGMTGQTIPESKRVGLRSNFLGMDI